MVDKKFKHDEKRWVTIILTMKNSIIIIFSLSPLPPNIIDEQVKKEHITMGNRKK